MRFKFKLFLDLPQKIKKLFYKEKEDDNQKEELDRLLKIASQLPGVVYQYRLYPDGSSCFPFASDAIKQIYRVTPKEVKEDASKVFGDIHPDDIENVVSSINLSAQELTPWQHEYRVKFSDGTVRTLYGNALPQLENDGSVLWHGFITDITERKKVEEELRMNEERYRLLAENARDVIWTMNLDGTITYISPSVERLRGFTVEEAMNQPLDKILTPDSQAISVGYVQRLYAAFVAGLPLPDFRGELEYYCKDGSTLWTECLTYPVLGSDGSSLTMLGVSRDITERKKMEEALRESEKRYRLLIETASEGIFVAQGGKFKFANPIMLEIFGYSYDEILKIPFLELVHPDEKERVGNNHSNRLKGEPVDSKYHFRILKKGGVIKWIELNSVKIDWEGEPATLNLISDITEAKEAELEIKLKNEELQKLNSEKDKFFSIIAHDLRGPLGGFVGLTEIMAEETNYFSDSDRKGMMLDMSRSARNTFNLLENLLEWSQMSRGLTDFRPQALDLMDVVTECRNIVADAAQVKGIAVVSDISAKTELFADKNMLQTVIRNLLSNAIKFTPNEGKVTISAELAPNNMALISVQDTGIGMSEAIRSNLFQIDANTKRSGTNGEPSTGLGLLLCKEFINKHGGKIEVESEQNRGTLFRFTIPSGVNQKEQKTSEIVVTSSLSVNPFDSLHVLIAEDDEISALLLSAMVKKFSKQLSRVTTGEKAVEFCRTHPEIDIVLMDIAMPVLDGYEATRQIRLFNKEVIIIAQTTFTQTADREKALSAGFNDYIIKPFSRDLLTEIIKKYFTN